ncbi:MAG: alpha-amylase [Desulfurococcaceae archaeon]|nr:alpha-amylase [Desulfurococcaceae archaeon]
MLSVVLMFEVHQPYRLNPQLHERLIEKALRGALDVKDVEDAIFDSELNRRVINRVADNCYIPATKIIIEGIERFKSSSKKFKVSFSISGVFLEQALMWRRDVVEVFQRAVNTGMVELIEQTYYHSLAAFIPHYGFEELRDQVLEHRRIIRELFNYEPVSVENTEFTYNNDIACFFENMGFKAVLTEGVDWVLGWRSPNYVYRARGCEIPVLTRNYRLSDDVGFRFSDRRWDQYPLTADKYAEWLSKTPGDVVLIAVDYETFGEHHKAETGILEFLRWLPVEVLRRENLEFLTPREAVEKYRPVDYYDVPPWSTISWADERDLSAWLGNRMQQKAFSALCELRPYVVALGEPGILSLWKKLTISDHFYYMATKSGPTGEVHSYFSPYKDSAIAFGVYMEAIATLWLIVAERVKSRRKSVLSRLVVPPQKAFYFTRPTGEYTGFSARSLRELLEVVERVPPESFLHHLHRGDFEKWLVDVFFLDELRGALEELRSRTASYYEKLSDFKKIIRSVIED